MLKIAHGPLIIGILSIAVMSAYGKLPQVGEMPVPDVKNVTVRSTVSFDSLSNIYTYRYSVTNPSYNTGGISDILIDMTAPAGYRPPTYKANLTLPTLNEPFKAELEDLPSDIPNGATLIPFGMQLPHNWMFSMTAEGEAKMGAFSDEQGHSGNVQPGETKDKFIIFSPGLPTIKTITLRPAWELIVSDEASLEEQETAAKVDEALKLHVPALAPSPAYPGSLDQWDEFRDDIARAIKLGWISDPAFGQKLQTDLAKARTAFDKQGAAYIRKPLTTLLNDIKASSNSQRNEMAYDLLSFNTQTLLNSASPQGSTPSQPQTSLKYTFVTNDSQFLQVDKTVTITAKVVDQENNDAPVVGKSMGLYAEGANSGQSIIEKTDSQGEISLSYKGMAPGKDIVHIVPLKRDSTQTTNTLPPDLASSVTWQGGPDLTLEYFSPPMIRWRGTGTIYVTDATKNVGTTPTSAPTVTRYYVSASNPVIPSVAQVVAERTVPVLQPGEINRSSGMNVPLPANLKPGIYYLAACVNVTKTVGETHFNNNCHTDKVFLMMAPQTPPHK